MKAVIMAGGEGSRLRPLTCNMPKPLARLCGKSVLEYIFDLLQQHGVHEACVSLGYLAEQISQRYPDGQYDGLPLSFVKEETPLGTAGGVALCARGWDDDFLVISGDAMCDLDLSEAITRHKSSGAAVTILGVEVDDPREYGLMQLDENGDVAAFVEKPAWGQVTTNLANTGIYLLRADVINLIPQDNKYDFAQDLFPALLARGERIACCKSIGYWCDIGDLPAYLQCQRDILDGAVQCNMPPSHSIHGDFTLIPPVHLGKNVTIANGAVIGPHAILDDNSRVGERAKVRGSVLLAYADVAADACLTGVIVCNGAQLRSGVQLFEGATVGEGACIGANATLMPGVAVWPNKQVEPAAQVQQHVKYGHQNAALFEDNGIGGSEGMRLTPETCAALGCAIGSVKSCKKAGIAHDGTPRAHALAMALTSGLLTTGCHVWNFTCLDGNTGSNSNTGGNSFVAQLSFYTAFCGLGIGIFITGGEEPSIMLRGEGGLSVPRQLEREIETRLRRAEFTLADDEDCHEIANMQAIKTMYARELMQQAPQGLKGTSVRVTSPNPHVQATLEHTLDRLDCAVGQGSLALHVSDDGTQLCAHEHDQHYTHEQLLAICCKAELAHGDIALPYDAPEMLDELAMHEGRTALRYLSCPADQTDNKARQLAARQHWVRDGLFLAVKLLQVMHERKRSLSELMAELPPCHVQRKRFSLPCSPSMLQQVIGEQDEHVLTAREGLMLRRENGRILITPGKSGRHAHVLAEAATAEIAQELCDFAGKLLTE
ncbi:MAG: sugar phosphate nucleotidyltransferase [Oscillospiraceae bacterium]|nr:sugar phosphate nucleotidyltransferase [Oscillospiraceae bacterium]